MRPTLKQKLCMAMLLFSSMLLVLDASAQVKKLVSGIVRDTSGNPISGVTVREKGSKGGGSITDEMGRFSINVGNNAVLTLSSISHITKDVVVGTSTELVIQLETSRKELQEVVVTALGINKEKRALGYATSTIKSAVIGEAGTPNVVTALYGDIPGAKIAAAPGGATSGVSVIIRGASSINFQQQPLLIIDGVPARNGDFNSNSPSGANISPSRIGNNGISEINPEDVESVTVLKGAAAAALYGSEASNGVILITTKSGKGKKGFGLEVNTYYDEDHIAYMPQFQTVRGPGHFVDYSTLHTGNINASNENGLDVNGWDHVNYNGQNYRSLVNSIGTGGSTTPNLYFGPVYDGQPTIYWDHQVRPIYRKKTVMPTPGKPDTTRL